MKICKKCIMPDSFPDIDFSNGICGYCRNHSRAKVAPPGDKKLLEILNSENKGVEYDCVVPLSGGKDSSYALFYIVRELGLRALAVYFDSGFSKGKPNVERICQNLSVNLITVKSRKNFRLKAIEEGLYIGKYTSDFFAICANCENNNRTAAINEATKRKIPFIIWGSTEFENIPKKYSDSESETFREWYASSISYIKSIFKRLFWIFQLHTTLVNRCKIILHFVKYFYYIVRDNIDTEVPEGYKRLNPLLRVSLDNKKVKTIYLYDYIEYDPYKRIEVLRKEVGWEAPSGAEARMDCRLHSIINYTHLRKTGITHDGMFLARMIREGLLSRKEAMEKEEILKEYSKIECQKLLEDLGFQGKAII